MTEKARVLFLGYWNLADGLTQATIVPHLQLLKSHPEVDYVHFANTQREPVSTADAELIKSMNVDYTPLFSKNLTIYHFNKIYDFIYFPREIIKLCRQNGINLIIARGAPAGSLAWLVYRKIHIPYVVESFEPHADYMRYGKVWSRFDLRYLMQTYWENRQKQTARLFVTVSEKYRNLLVQQGIPSSRLAVAACEVDFSLFQQNFVLRKKMRAYWQWDNAIVGVYVGKFGGIYEELKAFLWFKAAADYFGDSFKLLIVSPTEPVYIKQMLSKVGLNSQQVKHVKCQHREVPDYLSMADFAFATYKQTPVSAFLSPIKLGEYWAMGLVVLMPEGIGDDSDLVKSEDAGVVVQSIPERYHFEKLSHLIAEPSIHDRIRTFAVKHRSLANTESVYHSVLV